MCANNMPSKKADPCPGKESIPLLQGTESDVKKAAFALSFLFVLLFSVAIALRQGIIVAQAAVNSLCN